MQATARPVTSTCGCGGERTRTADFYVANVALYQLSYTPEGTPSLGPVPEAAGVARPEGWVRIRPDGEAGVQASVCSRMRTGSPVSSSSTSKTSSSSASSSYAP